MTSLVRLTLPDVEMPQAFQPEERCIEFDLCSLGSVTPEMLSNCTLTDAEMLVD